MSEIFQRHRQTSQARPTERQHCPPQLIYDIILLDSFMYTFYMSINSVLSLLQSLLVDSCNISLADHVPRTHEFGTAVGNALILDSIQAPTRCLDTLLKTVFTQ